MPIEQTVGPLGGGRNDDRRWILCSLFSVSESAKQKAKSTEQKQCQHKRKVLIDLVYGSDQGRSFEGTRTGLVRGGGKARCGGGSEGSVTIGVIAGLIGRHV